jgi:TM2 domain-containing membrane protein YozV
MPGTSLRRTGDHALQPPKDSGLAYVLWFGCFFGLSGLHRLYMGRTASGVLWLLTGGLCFVGQLVDLFLMQRMVEDSNEGRGW